MLGRIHTLNLSYTKITDVSALGNVHTLDLSLTDKFKSDYIAFYDACRYGKAEEVKRILSDKQVLANDTGNETNQNGWEVSYYPQKIDNNNDQVLKVLKVLKARGPVEQVLNQQVAGELLSDIIQEDSMKADEGELERLKKGRAEVLKLLFWNGNVVDLVEEGKGDGMSDLDMAKAEEIMNLSRIVFKEIIPSEFVQTEDGLLVLHKGKYFIRSDVAKDEIARLSCNNSEAVILFQSTADAIHELKTNSMVEVWVRKVGSHDFIEVYGSNQTSPLPEEVIPEFAKVVFSYLYLAISAKRQFADFVLKYLQDTSLQETCEGLCAIFVQQTFWGLAASEAKRSELGIDESVPGSEIIRFYVQKEMKAMGSVLLSIKCDAHKLAKVNRKMKCTGCDSFCDEAIIDTGATISSIPCRERWDDTTRKYKKANLIARYSGDYIDSLNTNMDHTTLTTLLTGVGEASLPVIKWKDPLELSIDSELPLREIEQMVVANGSNIIGLDVISRYKLTITPFHDNCGRTKLRFEFNEINDMDMINTMLNGSQDLSEHMNKEEEVNDDNA
eukprot:gene6557-7233_t